MEKPPSNELIQQVLIGGFEPLRQAGFKKVISGETSLDEIFQVTLDT